VLEELKGYLKMKFNSQTVQFSILRVKFFVGCVEFLFVLVSAQLSWGSFYFGQKMLKNWVCYEVF